MIFTANLPSYFLFSCCLMINDPVSFGAKHYIEYQYALLRTSYFSPTHRKEKPATGQLHDIASNLAILRKDHRYVLYYLY